MYKSNLKSKEVIEDSKRIELSELNKFIILMRGTNTKILKIFLNWSYNGKPSGNMGLVINMNKKRLTLVYCIDNIPFICKVTLKKKLTYNGGYKYFMLCPSCGKSIRTLYKAPSKDYFLCRECSDLIYSDQKNNKTNDKWFKYF